ncbi:MAG: EAL domain-containing protein, partial [Gammaproteobacteria bacterium]|nr:EAL domain-containing protein [Gammaproteobacteria bacterium]
RLRKLSDSIRQIHSDGAGILWVVDNDNVIGTFQNGEMTERVRIQASSDVVGLGTSNSGLVWAATKDSLYSFDGFGTDAETPVREFTGLDEVTSIFVDRENSVWLASDSRLIRFLGDRFRHYRLSSGTEQITVWGITEGRDGQFWFGTQSGLILRNPDETLVSIDAEHGVPDGAVRDVVVDNNGDIWFSVSKEGLFRLQPGDTQVRRVASMNQLDILDIGVSVDGAIWYSTPSSGVYRYSPHDEVTANFHVPEGTSVYTLDTWGDGSVWYGADDLGLVRLVPGEDGSYDQTIYDQEGVLENRLFDHIRLTGPDEAWIATDEGGLYFFSGGEFESFGRDTPLADQTVYLVEPLENQTIVVGGEQGLYQFVPGTPGVAHYDQRVGFIGLETNVHATYRDSSGGLWIGTVDGATRMDVSQPMPQPVEPTPTIVRVETDRARRPILDNKEVNPRELGLHIEFAAVSLLNPKGIEYSYKLQGSDVDWGPATTNRTVSYPTIPPGDYEFMVRARSPGGEWGREYASHRFTVLPFIWQQPFFVLLAVAVFLLLTRAAMVYRTRKIQWLNDTLRAQVDERTESIKQAKEKLEQSNYQLSQEIEERKKAHKERAEIEARFRRAFENAPIGMGLLDSDGVLFDANPALIKMFWRDAKCLPEMAFAALVADEERDRFADEFSNLVIDSVDTIDQTLTCEDSAGDSLQTVVNVSPVRSEAGDFLYAVLQVQDITESMKLTVQLEYQASYDELTGLLNRRAFEAELQRAWDRGTGGKGPSYLMFMDLDQFKVVNDTSGHGAGDQLLRRISELLGESVRGNDIVARLGGDEFGIILWECPTEVASRIAESIRTSIEDYRFHWDTETYRVGVSIGGLPIDPEVGDISELQQLADSACYAAKEAGRNRVHMVSGEKDSARIHRGQVRWVQRLREAMDSNRFAIYGQVMKPLAEHAAELERIEILLRLRDPESRKLIPPGAFLPAAERYGLSVELDKWVVGSLLDMLFIHQSFQAVQRQYWINLSGTSIGDKRFATFLRDAMQRSPLPPGTINFEITETAVIRSISEAGRLMAELKEMGCRFALDDFGSGLSSFGYLKKLPIDYIKIDGTFIRDILVDETDRIFVKSIIDIARSLKIKTIAEFVENEDMLELVCDMGADYAQGFYIGRPFVLAPRFPGTGGQTNEPLDIQAIAG